MTLSTLSVVGCFLGLSRQRSDARRYPAIDPLISWSKYNDRFSEYGTESVRNRINSISQAQQMIFQSDEIGKKMSVVGEEGISIDDFVTYLKGEFYDAVYLQQNAFDPVDTAVSMERQNEQLEVVTKIIGRKFKFDSRENARNFFLDLTDKVIQLNYTPKDNFCYKESRDKILNMIEGE